MEHFIDVMKAKYEGRLGYLLIGQESVVFVDVFPKETIEEGEVSLAKTAAVAALLGPIASGAYAASKSAHLKIVDTEDKKRLREIFDNCIETRDKSLLSSISLEQLCKADPLLKLQERHITYSSILKMATKELSTIVITKQVHTGLAAEIYGNLKTLEFKVLADEVAFRNAVSQIKQLLPGKFSS